VPNPQGHRISGSGRCMTVQLRTNTKRPQAFAIRRNVTKARNRGPDPTWHASRFSKPVQESSQVRGTTICNG